VGALIADVTPMGGPSDMSLFIPPFEHIDEYRSLIANVLIVRFRQRAAYASQRQIQIPEIIEKRCDSSRAVFETVEGNRMRVETGSRACP
jgi:hypothetical protein